MPLVACVFCSYGRKTDQNLYHMLSAILKQAFQGFSELPNPVRRLYDVHKRRETTPSKEELISTLSEVLEDSPHIFVVIDALDECNAEDRREILEILFDLQLRHDLRLLCTSRDVVEVTELFYEDVPRATIRATDTDVREYLEPRLISLGRFVRGDTELQRLVMNKITSSADGMYVKTLSFPLGSKTHVFNAGFS